MGLDNESSQMVELLASTSEQVESFPFVSIHSVASRRGDIDDALNDVFRLRNERFTLVCPVDWWDTPYRHPNERGFFQNSFVFADPLLADQRFPEVLVKLATIAADWLMANPRSGARHLHRYAWHDHAAAGRIVVTAFILREGIQRNLLPPALARVLAAGVLDHADYLVADENYAAHHNHGFASDAALMLAARTLSPAPQTKRWAEIAERRFAAILDHTIDREDAIHLEHSPHYHWNIQSALSRLAAAGLFDGLDLANLACQMEKSGAWLVAPDGTLPPIGDTSVGERPTPAVATISRSRSGMRVFRAAGYAAIRSGGSALFVTAAHHPTAHKHADDGSFCLYEGGRPIILDSGSPGYEYESPEFAYGTSPAAHAGICVDGFDWTQTNSPYGSGIVASSELDGIYAVLTQNPGAVPGGGAARRALIYGPSRFLLIFDDVDAKPTQELFRTLPLSPGLEPVLETPVEAEILSEGVTIARFMQLPSAGMLLDRVEIASGRREPEMRGFTFPSHERPKPSYDVTLRGPAHHPRGLAVLLAETAKSEPLAINWSQSDELLDVGVSGLIESILTIRIGKNSIALERPV
jgi:heparinase II/III-like protein